MIPRLQNELQCSFLYGCKLPMPVAPRSLDYSDSCVVSVTSELSRDFQHGLTFSNFALQSVVFPEYQDDKTSQKPIQSNVFYSVDMTRGLGEGISELHFNVRYLF